MWEKSYAIASNHLKISFLSQNFMRALGVTMMLFIPGIFTSVSNYLSSNICSGYELIPKRHCLAQHLFFGGDGPRIQTSPQIYIWVIVVSSLSTITISILLLSFHAQAGQSVRVLINRYFQGKVNEMLALLGFRRSRTQTATEDGSIAEAGGLSCAGAPGFL